MSEYRFVFVQAASGSATQATPAAPAAPPVPTRDQLREQIRQSIKEAQAAAREARAAATVTTGDGRVITIDGRPVIADAVQGVPGIRIQGGGMQDVIPRQAVDISIAFFVMIAVIIIGWPLARALGRRLERRADAPALPDPAIAAQLQRIEQAVEAMSIEVERISESQRFLAKLQSGAAGDRAALGTAERR